MLVAVVLAGCWTGESSPPPPPVETAHVAERPRPHARTSTWIGRYECAQGVTGLQLTLDIEPDGSTTGVFAFSAVPDNPTVPSGSYRIRGTATRLPEGGFAVDLHGESWIDQPRNYIMVGVQASSDPGRRHLSGRITNATCGLVDVDRRD